MTNSITLFGSNNPDAIALSRLYDPDIHEPSDESKYVPTPHSLVIDDVNEETLGVLFYVESIHPVTHKSTLKPVRIMIDADQDGEADTTKILSYGNDRFMVYFDDRVEPTRLNIDAKLAIYGSANVEYRLTRKNMEGEDEIISVYLNSDEQISGNRIPLRPTPGNPAVKYLTDCHTLNTINDGEIIVLEVFDSVGVITAKVYLVAKRATILNDLNSSSSPIVDFYITSNQMANGGHYIYTTQDPESINLTGNVVFADGRFIQVAVNNDDCRVYGLEDLIPSFPGHKQPFLCKYFISRKQPAEGAIDNGKTRFVMAESFITIVSNQSAHEVKLSVIPVWNGAHNRYDLKFFAYTVLRDSVTDVTPHVTMIKEFVGDKFGETQEIEFEIDLQNLFGSEVSVMHTQKTWIKVSHYSFDGERYILADSENAYFVYGVEGSTIRRPVIHFDEVLEQYFIPTSVFENQEAFVDAFYTRANPLFDTSVTSEAYTPTHFTVRDIFSGNVLISDPIPVEEYSQAWNILDINNPSKLMNRNVIVEFLEKIEDSYRIIYGVPVDVYKSSTGYNT